MHRNDPLHRRRPKRGAARWFALLLILLAPPAAASADLCEAAATRAARSTGVPLAVLRALALTETGRTQQDRFAPWPWTVNVAGQGAWFATREAALGHARAALARGTTSFDLGCFQVNYRWHGAAFASLDAMIDPDTNAAYAARFLRDLFAETGDWHEAAAAYHSRTPQHAARYRARFTRILAGLDPPADTPVPATAVAAPPARVATDRGRTPRPNRFPLLIASAEAAAPASPGSLMPAAAGLGGRPLLGAP